MKLLFSIISLFFFVNNVNATPTLFHVKIENSNEPHLGLWYQKEETAPLTYNRIPITATGEMTFELDIPYEQIMFVEYRKKRIEVLVQNGAETSIFFDANDINRSLSFEGNTAKENNFIAEFNRNFGYDKYLHYTLSYVAFSLPRIVNRQADTRTAAQYFRFRDERISEINAWIYSQQSKNIHPKIFRKIQVTAKYTDLTERMAYAIVNKDRMGLIELLKVKESYPVTKEDYSDTSLLDYDAYKNYLIARMQYEYLPSEYGNARQVAPILYDLVSNNFDSKARRFLQAEILCKYINKTGEPSFGQERYPQFYKENRYAEYTEKVQETYGSDLNAITASPAPLLEFYTTDGRKMALQNYYGKVVYIAFWASWCKPCLQNFEKSEATRKKLQDMGVVLLNVSIDRESEAFYNALNKHEILGNNVLAASIDKTTIEYNLSTIPAYYIIDKNGKFAFLSENEDRDIVKEFQYLVSKN